MVNITELNELSCRTFILPPAIVPLYTINYFNKILKIFFNTLLLKKSNRKYKVSNSLLYDWKWKNFIVEKCFAIPPLIILEFSLWRGWGLSGAPWKYWSWIIQCVCIHKEWSIRLQVPINYIYLFCLFNIFAMAELFLLIYMAINKHIVEKRNYIN